MWLVDDRKHKNHLRIFSKANKPASHQLETCGPRSKSKATSSHIVTGSLCDTAIKPDPTSFVNSIKACKGPPKMCSAICSLNCPDGRDVMLTKTDINQRTVRRYVISTFCVDLSEVLAQLIQFSSVQHSPPFRLLKCHQESMTSFLLLIDNPRRV